MKDAIPIIAAIAAAIGILLHPARRLCVLAAHRWRRRQARAICIELQGRVRDHAPNYCLPMGRA